MLTTLLLLLLFAIVSAMDNVDKTHHSANYYSSGARQKEPSTREREFRTLIENVKVPFDNEEHEVQVSTRNPWPIQRNDPSEPMFQDHSTHANLLFEDEVENDSNEGNPRASRPKHNSFFRTRISNFFLNLCNQRNPKESPFVSMFMKSKKTLLKNLNYNFNKENLFNGKSNYDQLIHFLEATDKKVFQPLIYMTCLQVMFPDKKPEKLFGTFFNHTENLNYWVGVWINEIEDLRNIQPHDLPEVKDGFFFKVLHQLFFYYSSRDPKVYAKIIPMLQKIVADNIDRVRNLVDDELAKIRSKIFISGGLPLLIVNLSEESNLLEIFMAETDKTKDDFTYYASESAELFRYNCPTAYYPTRLSDDHKFTSEPQDYQMNLSTKDIKSIQNSASYYEDKAYLWKFANSGNNDLSKTIKPLYKKLLRKEKKLLRNAFKEMMKNEES